MTIEPTLLFQFSARDGQPRVAHFANGELRPSADPVTAYALASKAVAEGDLLEDVIGTIVWDAPRTLDDFVSTETLLPPITHPDPAHLFGTGTGLTHLGSASARNKMHAAGTEETDSMRMFRWGIEGGRPDGDGPGVQPEWFYKGTGHSVVAPGANLVSPSFALDGGEEPELAGIYLIGRDGTPWRLGFALANEFSDHVTEKQNYLLLAHSKLRQFSFGPALRIGKAPEDIRGVSRILRDGVEIWSKPFLTGAANMSHSLENLEHHHFKYEIFRQPGDVHVHMFGTATLSCVDGVICQDADVFEIGASGFGPPLRNGLAIAPAAAANRRVSVKSL